MSEQKKQNIGLIYKLGAFLAFLMLGYLGIRGYKDSVEKLKIKGCSDEIRELMMNVQERFRTARDYGNLDYKQAASMRLFPKSLNKPGYSEPINSYNGGVDIYYSSTSPEVNNGAFEISFQGLLFSKDNASDEGKSILLEKYRDYKTYHKFLEQSILPSNTLR